MDKVLDYNQLDKVSLQEIYEYYDKLSLEDLFEKKIYIDYYGYETTNFDMLTNILYWRNRKINTIYDTKEHVMHDYEIINILRKFIETPGNSDKIKRIFAKQVDRKYSYGGKYFLEGNTGLMSSLLINSLYMVYEYLLNIGVKVNGHDDGLIIFIKLIRTNMKLIPQEHLDAINNIFKIFIQNKELRRLLNYFNSKYEEWANSIVNKDWYKNNYKEIILKYKPMFYNFTSILQHPEVYKLVEHYANTDLTIFKEKDYLDLIKSVFWDYYPEYDNYANNATPEFIDKIVRAILNNNLKGERGYLRHPKPTAPSHKSAHTRRMAADDREEALQEAREAFDEYHEEARQAALLSDRETILATRTKVNEEASAKAKAAELEPRAWHLGKRYNAFTDAHLKYLKYKMKYLSLKKLLNQMNN